LLHAIGNHIRRNDPSKRVLYVTSEKFINEFIDSLRFEKPASFRNKYRNLDCLLIDDIQFLVGRQSSQEEFFYTFNTLYDSHKQVVITSDRPPKELPTLEPRLISRFEWGVIADIQPPDLETRIAIMRKKAEEERLYIPDDVVLYIATQIKSNIRELEGSLLRITAFSAFTGTPLTVDSVQKILKDVVRPPDDAAHITIECIQKVVAKHFNLDIRDMKSKRRTDAVAFPRQIAMYLARTLTDEFSTTEIGDAFGGKDHTTVMHACNKIKARMATDPYFVAKVNQISQEIRAGKEE
jgi:chromosomal replication initiator protein